MSELKQEESGEGAASATYSTRRSSAQPQIDHTIQTSHIHMVSISSANEVPSQCLRPGDIYLLDELTRSSDITVQISVSMFVGCDAQASSQRAVGAL